MAISPSVLLGTTMERDAGGSDTCIPRTARRSTEGRIASGQSTLAASQGCFSRSTPAKRCDPSLSGVSILGCGSCLLLPVGGFLLVPSPARSPGWVGVGRGSGVGWFVFPLPCFKISPPVASCKTGLSPCHIMPTLRPVASCSGNARG